MIERMTELEELIRAGWGDCRQDQIPADWRTRRPEPLSTPTESYADSEAKALAAELWGRDSARKRAPRKKRRAERIAQQEGAMRQRIQSQRRREYLRELGRGEPA
jgi:hypothetical protein